MVETHRTPQATWVEVANQLTLELGTLLNLDALLKKLAQRLTELAGAERALVLTADSENETLNLGAITGTQILDARGRPKHIFFPTHNQGDDPIIARWLRGEVYPVANGDLARASTLASLAQAAELTVFFSVPLLIEHDLIGVFCLDNPSSHAQIQPDKQTLLSALAPTIAVILRNAVQHSQTTRELDDKVNELHRLRQIDRELSDTIKLRHVFDVTLDWAMRITNAEAASLALYEQDTDELRFALELGYPPPNDQIALLRSTYGGGIAHRVARSGRPEVIPDVSTDTDYVAISNAMHSHMSVPVMREDRVIAVITVESRRFNAFTDAHLDFVEKLSARAGVAIDNARLFSETAREREKLSHILGSIADIVMVTGQDDRLILINQSALAALYLYPERSYIGQLFPEVFDDTPLVSAFHHAKVMGQTMVEEVILPNKRTYHANFSYNEKIGWLIVMHDITPLKETDQLKNELVATVSHDLKQPLSVMNGYIELLQMNQKINPLGDNYIRMIQRSIQNMQHLIDDLLDMAKLETGVQIEVEAVSIKQVIEECLENVRQVAEAKEMRMDVELPDDLPRIAGDFKRLLQIFNNLVGNAVKYTQPEGHIIAKAERTTHSAVQITVQDNGIGISPEDQAHIFDRFYRVRRAETDTIEGTGLGLAIVKRLVEMHKGQIGIESRLGEGSKFIVTLPVFPDVDPRQTQSLPPAPPDGDSDY
ncbi:MAG: GAF domain-containing protein [Chloroflexi bacterium]|nr:GAF domain-containing protein [Chloroflexota bacterium]